MMRLRAYKSAINTLPRAASTLVTLGAQIFSVGPALLE
jgi:hypothetical protein